MRSVLGSRGLADGMSFDHLLPEPLASRGSTGPCSAPRCRLGVQQRSPSSLILLCSVPTHALQHYTSWRREGRPPTPAANLSLSSFTYSAQCRWPVLRRCQKEPLAGSSEEPLAGSGTQEPTGAAAKHGDGVGCDAARPTLRLGEGLASLGVKCIPFTSTATTSGDVELPATASAA
jgi:hypothetical protein